MNQRVKMGDRRRRQVAEQRAMAAMLLGYRPSADAHEPGWPVVCPKCGAVDRRCVPGCPLDDSP